MNSVSTIISTLSEEEKDAFIMQLKQKNRRGDTKNIDLFKILEQAPNTAHIDQLLYGKPSKGAYHALCKRLFDSLIDFIASKSFEDEQSEEMDIFKLILASRILFERKAYKIGFKTLQRAEHKAKSNDLYSVLAEVYYTKLQYAHFNASLSFDELVAQITLNNKNAAQEAQMNLLYAQIQQDLKVKKESIFKIIEARSKQFQLPLNATTTYRSLFKLMEIVNNAAHLSRNFASVSPFVVQVEKVLQAKEKQKAKHLFYHIHILYFLANIHFRNRNFQKAQHFLEEMLLEMNKDANHKRFFYPQFTLLLVLNQNYLGNLKEALQVLEHFNFNKHKHQIEYVYDLKLLQAILYMQQSDFEKSIQIFNEFYHSDQFYAKKVGEVWVVKKNLSEILLRIELDQMDLVESRIKSFRKKHAPYLKANNENRVLQFLSLVSEFYFNQEGNKKEYFLQKINTTFSAKKTNQEDIFVLSFFAWLKAKVTNTDVYKTTLELLV